MIANDVFDALRADDSPHVDVYRNEAKQEAPIPFVVFSVIGGNDDVCLDGDAYTKSRLVQLDVYARRGDQADNLFELMRARMLAATAFSVNAIDVSGAGDEQELDTKLYRVSREFTIRYP